MILDEVTSTFSSVRCEREPHGVVVGGKVTILLQGRSIRQLSAVPGRLVT